MKQWIRWLALVAGMGAALMAATIGAWRALPLPVLLLRCALAGVLASSFVFGAGEVAGRTLLRGLAEHQIDSARRRAEPESEDQTTRRAA